MALVAHGWAAPTVVDPAPAPQDAAGSLARLVDGLAALPGAEYVLAVDAEGERVRGETGGPPEADLAVLAWARRVASVSRERRQVFEDLVLTTDTAFHLVRLVPVDPDAPERDAAWVTVRIDRARGNLAWSRRTLAGLGAPGTTGGPRALSATPSRVPEPTSAPTPFGPPAEDAARGGSNGTMLASNARTAPVAHVSSGSATPAAAPDSHRPSPRFAPFEPATPFEPPTPIERDAPVTPSAPWPRRTPSSSWPTVRPQGTRPEPADAPAPRLPADREFPAPRPPQSPDGPARPTHPTSGSFPAAMPAADQAPEVPAPRPAGPDERPRHAWPRLEDREAAAARDRATGAGAWHAWPRLEDRPATPARTPLAEVADLAPSSSGPGVVESDDVVEAPAARRLPLSIRQAARWRADPADLDPADLDSADLEDEAFDDPAAPDGWVPAARTSTGTAPSVPAPRVGSLFTPATPTTAAPTPSAPTPAAPTRVTLTPAADPEREDDTGELELPLRAATVITPRPYAPKPGRAPLTDPWPATGTRRPDPEPDPQPDPSDDLPDLPRRRPGAHLAPELPATPRTAPTVSPVAAVAGTAAFSTEHSVLRRLLDGLRRLS